VISQRLETIPGVSGVQIWGQKRYAMRLWIDPVKLASYGLTVAEVRTALGKQNVELGKLTGANTELTVKLLETYLLPKNLII
jgi:HAE1 family hydrophobic/amphiphilic exporter-1/multidrug efflux pump